MMRYVIVWIRCSHGVLLSSGMCTSVVQSQCSVGTCYLHIQCRKGVTLKMETACTETSVVTGLYSVTIPKTAMGRRVLRSFRQLN
jgi:hypothetical protein